MRARTLTAFGLVLYLMAGTPAAAQCGGGLLSLEYFVPDSSVTALFSGTVTDVRQSTFMGNVIDPARPDSFVVVTFAVDRVWKGDLPKHVVVYRPAPVVRRELGGSPVYMHFEMGKPYVVVGHHLPAIERAQVGAEPSPDAVMTEMCGGGSRPFELAAPTLSDDLGPGWAPR